MIEKVRRNTDFVEDFTGSNLGDYVEIRDEGVCGFTEPFRLSWFLTITGAEYFHVYLWIAKDFSWTQEFKTISLFFGTIATLWCIVIFFNAFRVGNNDEVYSTVALFMWIFANYWWMTGDVHDDNYPDETSIYDQRAGESAIILFSAVCWLTLYYFVVIPFSVMPVSPEAIAAYDDGVYKPRFRFLKTFRQYENLHMYFWLMKDLCWNLNYITLWFFMLVPALFLAGDFFFISAFCKNSVVDTVHYATIFLWVCGNVTWALGEFFFTEYDEPIRIWHGSAEARKTARWYSSWILFASLIPVVALYSVWIPLTLMGKLDNTGEREGEDDVSFDNEDTKPTGWFRPLLHPDNDTDTDSHDPYPPYDNNQAPGGNIFIVDTKHPKSILKVKSSPFKRTPVDTCRSGHTSKSKKSVPRILHGELNTSEKVPVKHRIRFNFPPPADPAPYIPDSDEEISGSVLIPDFDPSSLMDSTTDSAVSSDRTSSDIDNVDRNHSELDCIDEWDCGESDSLLYFHDNDDDDDDDDAGVVEVQRSNALLPI